MRRLSRWCASGGTVSSENAHAWPGSRPSPVPPSEQIRRARSARCLRHPPQVEQICHGSGGALHSPTPAGPAVGGTGQQNGFVADCQDDLTPHWRNRRATEQIRRRTDVPRRVLRRAPLSGSDSAERMCRRAVGTVSPSPSCRNRCAAEQACHVRRALGDRACRGLRGTDAPRNRYAAPAAVRATPPAEGVYKEERICRALTRRAALSTMHPGREREET